MRRSLNQFIIKGKMAATPTMAPNQAELHSLQGEGGSDVFSSNRHSAFNETTAKRTMDLWTRDDAPVIRPTMIKQQQSSSSSTFYQPYPKTMPRYPTQLTGYGDDGCERVTKLSARSLWQNIR